MGLVEPIIMIVTILAELDKEPSHVFLQINSSVATTKIPTISNHGTNGEGPNKVAPGQRSRSEI